MGIVLVNATAAKNSGALSILNQFLEGVGKYGKKDCFVVFVDSYFKHPPIDNVRFVSINTKGWRKRIRWDATGFKNWIRDNHVLPSLIISLQNTGVNYLSDVPQVIYYHQPLTISSHKWNPLKREEFILFCYRYFYHYFVKCYLRENTHVVVQIPFIKNGFLRKFDIPSENVHIIPPKIEYANYDKVLDIAKEDDKRVHIIYPATGVVYKNHIVLLKALRLLKEEDSVQYKKIRLFFTLKEGDNKKIDKYRKKWRLEDVIVLRGRMPFQKLLSCYKNMDALLFPSYIETVGLPLLEAAGSGMMIKAADLPYAHEVLQGYEGVSYVNYKDERAWMEAIKDVCRNKKRYTPLRPNEDMKGWKDFFELVDKLKLKDKVQ